MIILGVQEKTHSWSKATCDQILDFFQDLHLQSTKIKWKLLFNQWCLEEKNVWSHIYCLEIYLFLDIFLHVSLYMSVSPFELLLSKNSTLLQNLKWNVPWTDLTRPSPSPSRRFLKMFCEVSMPTFVKFVIFRSYWQQKKTRYILFFLQKYLQVTELLRY